MLTQKKKHDHYHHTAHVIRHVMSFLYRLTHRHVDVHVDEMKPEQDMSKHEEGFEKLWKPLKIEEEQEEKTMMKTNEQVVKQIS